MDVDAIGCRATSTRLGFPRPGLVLLCSVAGVALALSGCVDIEGDRPGECDDGLDDDGDGATDCEDSSCFGAPVCDPSDDDDVPSPGPAGEMFELVGGAAGLWEDDRAEFELGGNGVAIADVNGDGFPDIYLAGNAMQWGLVRNRLYIGSGDGTFSEEAEARGLPAGASQVTGEEWAPVGATFADFDNDGDPDLFLANDGPNELYRNDSGVFTDVSEAAGLAAESTLSVGMALADYDGDGNLDLFVVNHLDRSGGAEELNLVGINGDLFHNLGDGSFERVSGLLPQPEPDGAGFVATWLDVDGDGDPDLYVANDEGTTLQPNQLYRNDGPDDAGGWLFTRVSESCGCDVAMFAMGVAVGDYDRDGLQDLYVTNLAKGGGEVLLQSQGNGGYVNTSLAASAVAALPGQREVSWGTKFLDADNDGWQDLFVAYGALVDPGDRSSFRAAGNVLLRNEGGTFAVAQDSGVEASAGTSEGAATVDYDLDGAMDLVVQNLDGQPSLYRNIGAAGGDWIGLHLEGTVSNRDGVGAVVQVTTDDAVLLREVFAGSTSIHSSSWKSLHFGLGSSSIQSVVVRWPSGQEDSFVPARTGEYLLVREGEGLVD